MFLAFKKLIKSPSPKLNSSGRFTSEEYYGLFYAPKSLKEMERILSSQVKSKVFTSTEIAFNQIPFEATLKDTLRQLGKPLYRINNNRNINSHEIIFYRFDLGGFRVTAQLHFLSNYFFLGQYFYNGLTLDKIAEIEGILSEKYIPGTTAQLNNILITDMRNNRIEICEDSHGLVQYISGNTQFLEKIRQEIKQVSEKRVLLERTLVNPIYASL